VLGAAVSARVAAGFGETVHLHRLLGGAPEGVMPVLLSGRRRKRAPLRRMMHASTVTDGLKSRIFWRGSGSGYIGIIPQMVRGLVDPMYR
jgi:hypothetical protein